jgi:peptidoglycan hydrolase-like protein with peptidoglycan-binding domain
LEGSLPELKGSVGDGGANAVQDVALVQAMLKIVEDAKAVAYFGNNYNGKYDPSTKAAITAFQTDNKLIAAANLKPDPAAKFEKSGLIDKNSQTFKTLTQALPADYKTMRIIEGTTAAYIEMPLAAYQASLQAVQLKNDLDVQFRQKVIQLVAQIYDDYKIVLSVPNDGWRRTFAQQADVNSDAGPGESNHQFGRAVDIGFQGLRWIAGDGQINKDNFWLDAAKMPEDKKQQFWNARNKIAFGPAIGLFKTNRKYDFIHVQAYSDDQVSYALSLARHLQVVSPNKMKWDFKAGKPNQYKSDLGLGGAVYMVGSSKEIWAGQAKINKADLATALNAKLAADKTFNIEKFMGLPAAPAVQGAGGANVKAPVVLKEADIKEDYLKALKIRLKAEFEAADARWKEWKPLK